MLENVYSEVVRVSSTMQQSVRSTKFRKHESSF